MNNYNSQNTDQYRKISLLSNFTYKIPDFVFFSRNIKYCAVEMCITRGNVINGGYEGQERTHAGKPGT